MQRDSWGKEKFVLEEPGESLTPARENNPPVMCWSSPRPVNTPGCALCSRAAPERTKISCGGDADFFSPCALVWSWEKCWRAQRSDVTATKWQKQDNINAMHSGITLVQSSSEACRVCERCRTVIVTAWDGTEALKLSQNKLSLF